MIDYKIKTLSDLTTFLNSNGFSNYNIDFEGEFIRNLIVTEGERTYIRSILSTEWLISDRGTVVEQGEHFGKHEISIKPN